MREPEDETLLKLRRRKARFRQRVMDDTSLSPAHRVALYHMADAMTKRKTALQFEQERRVVIFPSQEGIADKSGIDRHTVGLAIRVAADRGYLIRVKKGSGMSGNSEYEVIPKRRQNAGP